MDTEKCIQELVQFREKLYQNFNNRADTLMELVDAISSNGDSRSVVEYSLSPCFRRSYSTIFKALAEMEWEEEILARLLTPYLPRPQGRSFWLLGVDVTPQPRPFAPTLQDRSVVYQANPVKGNKPIAIGHQYSTVALLPEAEAGVSASWVVPLVTRRVGSHEDKELVGAAQMAALLRDEQLPYQTDLCVEVADTSYSKPAYLCANRQHPNLVTITRVRGNRTFYRARDTKHSQQAGVGHPTWYGQPFSLKEPTGWPEADEQLTLWERSRRGKLYRVELRAWHNLLMPGKHKPVRLPMHRHPFTLVQVVRYDEQGRLAFKRPLWLLVIGPRRQELTLTAIYQAYSQRFDLEHFFRFGKQKMLLADCQTPEDDREEKWWQLVHIAYAQLWLARHLARALPRPWERNLPAITARQLSPTLVQRDFGRIIRQIGTPAHPPKPRGISPGRPKGTKLPPRPRYSVVIKSQPLANSP